MGSDKHKRKSKHRRRSRSQERKKKKKRRKHSRRSRSSSTDSDGSAPPPPPQLLLLAAAVGDRPRCRELLQQGADVEYADAEGTTALHEACRHGHLPTARLLLRRGADAGAADGRGDTPAHLAARHCHLDLLAALLQADRPPEIEAVNARGETVFQLSAQAMEKQDVQSFQQEVQEQAGAQQRSPSLGVDDWEWQRRLADERSGGEEDEDAEWGAYGGGGWNADEYETPEEYAQRIWEEMQAHRRAQKEKERAAFGHRKKRHEAQRQAFGAHAEAESRRILEEARKQDAAWRAAVAEGQAGAKRAGYEARWQFFSSKNPEAEVGYPDVPWILPAEHASQEELQRVVLYGTAGREEQRKRLRTELIRWHPDKFISKFGRRLAAADRERVLLRVNAVSQQLNAINAAIQQAAA